MSGVAPSVQRLSAALLLVLVAGCASTSNVPVADPASADRAALYALKMVGKPYKYGGSSPAGFDCSGLVQYSYKQAGVKLPRETGDQLRASTPLQGSHLRRGDLLFFDQEGRKKSHVGIYLGDGKFVHAPSSGKRVRTDRIDSPYWKKHLSEARRI
jgi:cell wall-associated NlpC family hydrolase